MLTPSSGYKINQNVEELFFVWKEDLLTDAAPISGTLILPNYTVSYRSNHIVTLLRTSNITSKIIRFLDAVFFLVLKYGCVS
jgi:hypothetical protein